MLDVSFACSVEESDIFIKFMEKKSEIFCTFYGQKEEISATSSFFMFCVLCRHHHRMKGVDNSTDFSMLLTDITPRNFLQYTEKIRAELLLYVYSLIISTDLTINFFLF
jgi:hypothetical protein